MCVLEHGHSCLSNRSGSAAASDDEAEDTETEIPVQPVFTFSSCKAHGVYLYYQITAGDVGHCRKDNVASAFFFF